MKKGDRFHPLFVYLFSFSLCIAFSLQTGCAARVNTTSPAQPADPEPNHAEMRRIPAMVETVDVNVIESFPLQLTLTVTGNFQDGCEAPLKMAQQQEGDRINVTLYRELPTDTLCPSVLVPFQETVSLEGDFTSGAYTFDINGTIVEKTI